MLNFGGQSGELWCEGGEARFIQEMVLQSREFSDSLLWFTTLVSKESSIQRIRRTLDSVGAAEVKTIPMAQGNKVSRIIAWTFKPDLKRREWRFQRWNNPEPRN